MTNVPRALVGSVRAMARPARPSSELVAVREAAMAVTQDTGAIAAHPLARQIASRVVREFMRELDGAADDPFLRKLREASQCPFAVLATDPHIDTHRMFVDRRLARMIARGGRYLTGAEQKAEQAAIGEEIEKVLAGRYLRHLLERT